MNLVNRINDFISKISIEEIINKAVKVPGIKVNREKFLRKELKKYCTDKQINNAILTTPQKAKISPCIIETIADSCINKETLWTSTLSFGAGIAGGVVMAVTLTADLAQYFAHILIIAQELAYLYGWPQLFEDTNSINDEFDSGSSSVLLVFTGVMFGVEASNNVFKVLSKSVGTSKFGRDIISVIAKQAFYKPLQEILKQIGIKFNQKVMKQLFAKFCPLAGAFISGGLTYWSFRPMCNNLKKSLILCPQA